MTPIYFKGLHGIRALACMIVMFFHIDQFVPLFGLKSFGFHNTGMAGFGVIMFFVLSGFLITYLLLDEKKNFSRINIGKFYKRRILRIWPLYYLAIFISILLCKAGIIIIDKPEFITAIENYFLLGPNISYAFGVSIVTIVPLWSIGVEEQFYAFWPLVINDSKNVLKTLIRIIIIYLIIKICLRFMDNNLFYRLISSTTFDAMAVGGIFSYLVLTKNKSLNFFFSMPVQIFCWIFFLISLFYRPIHVSTLFDNEIHSVVYAIMIINVSCNFKSIIKLENAVCNFIGRISYGIYIYHMIIIVILSSLLKSIPVLKGQLLYLFVYIAVPSLTIIISWLSYEYFEKLFLGMKERYFTVKKIETGIVT